jgi:hypothetical protein
MTGLVTVNLGCAGRVVTATDVTTSAPALPAILPPGDGVVDMRSPPPATLRPKPPVQGVFVNARREDEPKFTYQATRAGQNGELEFEIATGPLHLPGVPGLAPQHE